MAGIHRIDTPRGSIIQTGKTSCKLVWDQGFGRERSGSFDRKQKIVDSEVLRYCKDYVPFISGMLVKSGILGTVVGSGEVKYVAPYARHQYYQTAQTRDYDPKRGGKWFERMKTAHKKDLLRAAERG